MSLTNDILSLKKAVVDNWGDIHNTANYFESIFTDGLDPKNQLAKLEQDISKINIDIPALDTLANQLNALENETSEKLDPVLSNLASLLSKEPDPAAAIRFVKENLPGLVTLPTIPNLNIKTLSNISEKLIQDGLSLKTKPFPNQNNTLNSSTVTTIQSGTSPNTSPPSSGNITQESNLSSNTQTNTPGESNGILDELHEHLENSLTQHAPDLDAMLTRIENLLTPEVAESLHQEINQFINRFDTTDLSLSNIINILKQASQNEFSEVETTINSTLPKLSGELTQFIEIFSDTLCNTLSADSELANLYYELTGTHENPTLLGIVCHIIAIPTVIVANGLKLGKFQFPKTIFQDNGAGKGNTTFSALQGAEIINELLKVFISYRVYESSRPKSINELLSVISELIKIGFSAGEAIATNPDTTSFTALVNNKKIWLTKVCTRVALPSLSLILKVRHYLYLRRREKQLNDTLFDIEKSKNKELTTPFIQFYNLFYQSSGVANSKFLSNGNKNDLSNFLDDTFKILKEAEKLTNLNIIHPGITSINAVFLSGAGKNALELHNYYTQQNSNDRILTNIRKVNKPEELDSKTIENCFDFIVNYPTGSLSSLIQVRSDLLNIRIVAASVTLTSAPTITNQSIIQLQQAIKGIQGTLNKIYDKANSDIDQSEQNTKNRIEINKSKRDSSLRNIDILGLLSEYGIGCAYFVVGNQKGFSIKSKLAAANALDVIPGFVGYCCQFYQDAVKPTKGKALLSEVISGIIGTGGKIGMCVLSSTMELTFIKNVSFSKGILTVSFNKEIRNSNNRTSFTSDDFNISGVSQPPTIGTISISPSNNADLLINLNGSTSQTGCIISPNQEKLYDLEGFPISSDQTNNVFNFTI